MQVTSGQCGSMGTVVVVVLLLVAGVRAEVGTQERLHAYSTVQYSLPEVDTGVVTCIQ